MRYIEVPGRIDENDRLILDELLDVIKPQRVKIDIWFRDEDEEEYREETKEEILEGIRSGFQDCLEGRTKPVGEAWDELRIKTTGQIDKEGYLILDSPLETLRERPLRPTKQQYVDVVIWFVDNNQSQEDAEYVCQVSELDSTRELVGIEHK
jgi:hypothetical protein